MLGLAALLPLVPAQAANDADVAALMQAIKKLEAENRELSRRLSALEGEQARRKPPVAHAEPSASVAQKKAAPETATVSQAPPQPTAGNRSLEQRVSELETAKTAQESAVRTIIRDTLSKTGPKINEFVSLGGALEVTGGRSSDFTGQKTDSIQLSTAELDLDVKVNDWVTGSMIIQYNTASNNVLFPTTPSFSNSTVDRFTLDRGAVTIGDVQRFPIFLKAGLDTLNFGTSTGVHRSDVLSIENPLTIEAFETRRTSVGIGFALPTPPAGPPAPGVIVPPVKPLVLGPQINRLARGLGFIPSPVPPPAPTPVVPTPQPPPFYGNFNVYDANTVSGINRKFGSSYNARLGYQTSGHCGRPYDDLKNSWVCPWAIDASVDYISSVFDSLFLESEYNNFMPQFRQIPGVAADLKVSLGPILLIAEYNTALKKAQFVDDTPRTVRIAPAAWQVALGYQLGWNPWVETIGAQGTFLAVAYSRSRDLAGVQLATTGGLSRVGFVPESRLALTAGEWVLEGTKIAVEYSHNWDYAVRKGGTGREADGVFVGLTYTW